MSHEEELAALRAEMDQAKEGMRELAQNQWAFFSELVDAGFSRSEALTLTVAQLQAMWANRDDSSGEES